MNGVAAHNRWLEPDDYFDDDVEINLNPVTRVFVTPKTEDSVFEKNV